MTREEEIIEASIDYQIATNPKCIAGEAFADFAHEMNVNQSFIAGAEWADKTMIEKACKFMNQLCDGFSIKDNIMGMSYSKEELLKDFRKAIEE